MRKSFNHNVGAYVSALASGAGTAVAAGAGDATEVDGAWKDRTGNLGASALLVIAFKAVLGDGETVSFAANLQDATSLAGAGAADFGAALASAVAATGGTGGTTEEGVAVLPIDLDGARSFVRAQVTPDLSASATDTLTWAAALIFPTDNVGY